MATKKVERHGSGEPGSPRSRPKKDSQVPEPPRFEDEQFALCVLDSLVDAGSLGTELTIPEPEPDDEADLNDESESWRDGETNQDRAIDALLELLESSRELLAKWERVGCDLTDINDDWNFEVDVRSLEGIEACTNLKHIAIRSTTGSLDLSPLKALLALETVDLSSARGGGIRRPLLAIKSLQRVVGTIGDDAVRTALLERGVVSG